MIPTDEQKKLIATYLKMSFISAYFNDELLIWIINNPRCKQYSKAYSHKELLTEYGLSEINQNWIVEAM